MRKNSNRECRPGMINRISLQLKGKPGTFQIEPLDPGQSRENSAADSSNESKPFVTTADSRPKDLRPST